MAIISGASARSQTPFRVRPVFGFVAVCRSFFSRENWSIRMSPIERDLDRDRPRDRDRDREPDLDASGTFYRRRYEDINPSPPPPRRVEFPYGVIVALAIFLVGQLVTGIWWAATLQSDVRYSQREDAKIWQKVETHDLQLGKLDTIVRNAVKEAMLDAGLRSNNNREDR